MSFMTKQSDERAIFELDLDALKNNVDHFRSLHPSHKILAVVKADFYGHGERIYEAIENKIDCLGVATVEEGIRLRKISDKPILLLGYVPESRYPFLLSHSLTATVYSEEVASSLDRFASSVRAYLPVHLKINTGMNRLGVRYSDEDSFKKVFSCERLCFEGVFTHFATAFDPFYALQKERFLSCLSSFKRAGRTFEYIHACSTVPSGERVAVGNTLRIGYGLFGYGDPALSPVLTVRARVVQVNTLFKGEKLGYGLTYQADDMKKIVTVSFGYADGYPRNLSNKGKVLYNGVFLPVVGRVCMDYLFADGTGTDIKTGDYVTILGKDLPADTLGFGYEILCKMGRKE